MGEGFLDRLAERLSRFTTTKTVFGDPFERDGVTVVPVSKVKVKFRAKRRGGSESEDLGGAGGGIVLNKPLGYLEIRSGTVRFRPVQDLDHTVLALLGSGLLLYLTLRTILSRGTEMNLSMMDTMRRLNQRINPLAPPPED